VATRRKRVLERSWENLKRKTGRRNSQLLLLRVEILTEGERPELLKDRNRTERDFPEKAVMIQAFLEFGQKKRGY